MRVGEAIAAVAAYERLAAKTGRPSPPAPKLAGKLADPADLGKLVDAFPTPDDFAGFAAKMPETRRSTRS